METLHWHLILSSSRKSKRKMRWVWHNSSSMQHPRPFEKITFSVLLLQNMIPETSTANNHQSLPFLLVGMSIISTESQVKWASTRPRFLLVLAPISSVSAAHRDWHRNLGLDSILGFDTFVQINLPWKTQSGKTYVNKILLCSHKLPSTTATTNWAMERLKSCVFESFVKS